MASNTRPGRLSSALRHLRGRISKELNHLGYNFQAINALGAPQVFQIELTNHCPMSCQMCPRTNLMTRALGHMDTALFRRIIDEIAPISEGVFLHHFGDSLVHPHLAENVAYAVRRGVRTYLSANPVLLTGRRAADLIDAGLHELVLSLDGVTPEISQAVRGAAARNVELAERHIMTLLSLRRERRSPTPSVILQIVRQRQNEHEINRWLDKWSAVQGIDKLKVKTFVTWDGEDKQINSLRIGSVPAADRIVCDKPWTSVTILWDGRVVPCCFDHDGLYTLGDLRTQSLREIWNGSRVRAFRRAHRDRKLDAVRLCRKCVDKEGYPVRKWFYPLNRGFGAIAPLAGEDMGAALEMRSGRNVT